MTHEMSLFARIIVKCTLDKIRESLPSARVSLSRSGENCIVDVTCGKSKLTARVGIGVDAQIELFASSPSLQTKYPLSHPDTLDRIVSQLVGLIKTVVDPFDDETLDPDLLRKLLVCKGMLTVQGQAEEHKQWTYALAEEALKDFGLEPIRFPNSRRDQIRRAFLLLVRLESAPAASKAACQVAFETASQELGRLKIDGKQVAYNPSLLYQNPTRLQDLKNEVIKACHSYKVFLEEETLEFVIEEWHRNRGGNSPLED